MTPDPQFDSENLARAEAILLDDEIGKRYFQGELYGRDGNRLIDMTLERQGGKVLELDEKTIGRLFMIPDGSIVWTRVVPETADAPAGIAVQSSVAFGLMAINAYRLGFEYISLFAAGRGPLKQGEIDVFVGFDVWPKFGFNAPVTPVELNRYPLAELTGVQTVQDIIAVDPQWWSAHGTGRTMRFDLGAKSRNWAILLHYLYDALVERRS